MRSLRWLLLAAILVLTAGLFAIYKNQRVVARGRQRAVPPSLPVGTLGNAQEWEWGQSADGKPAVKVKAKNSTQTDSEHMLLEEIELRLYMKDAKHYDRVRSPRAEFSTVDNKLYAPGEAEITLNIPSEGEEPNNLTVIRAAAVNFDSQSGEAGTTQPVAFSFAGGSGTSVGASYNPTTHELHLAGGVVLDLRGKKPGARAMHVESAELTYSEADSLVHLDPWSKLTRGETTMSGGPAVIHLTKDTEKTLESVDVSGVTGVDKRPGRQLEYTAGQLHVKYNDDHDIETLNGSGGAKLVSHGNGAITSMTGQSVDLFFNTQTGDSELATAIAKGGARIESKPVPDPKGKAGDTKIMLSEVLNLHMKPGGKDIDRVDTPVRASLEFVPAMPDRHRRILRSSDMDIRYGEKSAVQSFHANSATTESYPSVNEKKKRPTLAVAHTSSRVLDASFDDNSEIRVMKQLGDFRYDQGTRKAQATNGILENDKDLMTLDGAARVSDETGSTAADHIELNQETGDFDAKGHVATTRLPETKKPGDPNAGSDMLDKSEPTQGLANRVTSTKGNRNLHYLGDAVLWQASNRIQADRIDIDREAKSLVATDKVISQFQDKGSEKKKPAATIVRSQKLVYTDTDRQAVYTGGVTFRRAELSVDSATLIAFLNDDKSDADSRIHHAIADGKVTILKTAPGRRRTGRSEHAEYYTEEGKITLTGGEPTLEDTVRGNSRGQKITYFTDDDRLTIDGEAEKPVRTLLHKKKR